MEENPDKKCSDPLLRSKNYEPDWYDTYEIHDFCKKEGWSPDNYDTYKLKKQNVMKYIYTVLSPVHDGP